MTPDTIRTLDGPALTKLAWELGLAPEDVQWYGVPLGFGCGPRSWQPHLDLAQAYAIFVGLRTRDYTTSCCWFGDDRQYGEVWACDTHLRAWSVRWPQEVSTEAHALLLCAVLAVAQNQPAGARGGP